MKIYELFEESKPDYFNRLESELNIKRLGHGAFARVFQHPTHPDVVVKIFTDEDKAYKAYLKFAQARQHNKYIPKILSVHKHVNNPKKRDKDRDVDELVDDKYSIVFMEKLQPATPADIKKFIYSLPKGWEEGGEEIALYKGLQDLLPTSWLKLSKQREDPELAEFAKFLVYILRSTSHFPDLHDKNVMKRGQQIVFTDPTS